MDENYEREMSHFAEVWRSKNVFLCFALHDVLITRFSNYVKIASKLGVLPGDLKFYTKVYASVMGMNGAEIFPG